MVTGGFYYSGLDSTEILNHGGGAVEWVTMEPLPSPRYGLKAAQINNRLIITGTVFWAVKPDSIHCNESGEHLMQHEIDLEILLEFGKDFFTT